MTTTCAGRSIPELELDADEVRRQFLEWDREVLDDLLELLPDPQAMRAELGLLDDKGEAVNAQPEGDYYTLAEVSRHLSRARRTIYDDRKRGLVSFVKWGRGTRITGAELARYEAKLRALEHGATLADVHQLDRKR